MFSMLMSLPIDHVTVCGSSLERMRADFADVGLRTTYGGRHANGVTHMDLLTFPDGSYIELIAPVGSLSGAAGMMSGWAKLMEADAGCGAWAVRSSDVHAEVAHLRRGGIEVRGPESGSRYRPDGTKLEWETALVGPGPAGSVLPFFIQDKTPRDQRVPAPPQEISIHGVAAVVIGVRDLRSSIALFQRAFEFEEAIVEDHPDFGAATLAFFSNTPLILASAAGTNSWLTERLVKFGECPAAFLLEASAESSAKNVGLATKSTHWFGREVAWFDLQRLHGTRLGLIQ
jgi:glyoxalase-like protein